MRRQSYILIIETILFAGLAGLAGLYLTAGFLLVLGVLSPHLVRFPSYHSVYTRILPALVAGLAAFWWIFRSPFFSALSPVAGKDPVPIPEAFSAVSLLFTRYSFELVLTSYLILLFSLLIFRIHRMRQIARDGQERDG